MFFFCLLYIWHRFCLVFRWWEKKQGEFSVLVASVLQGRLPKTLAPSLLLNWYIIAVNISSDIVSYMCLMSRLNSPLRYEISLVNPWNLAELISSFFLDRYGIDPEVRGSSYTELRHEDVPVRKKILVNLSGDWAFSWSPHCLEQKKRQKILSNQKETFTNSFCVSHLSVFNLALCLSRF